MHKRLAGLYVTLIAVAFSGCIQEVAEQTREAARRDVESQRLAALASAYWAFINAEHKGPADWEDLLAFARQSGGNLEALEQLQAEDCVVIWGKHFKDALVGTRDYIIAYPQNAPEEGGLAVTMDGTVKDLTAEELRKALDFQDSLGRGGAAAGSPTPPSGTAGDPRVADLLSDDPQRRDIRLHKLGLEKDDAPNQGISDALVVLLKSDETNARIRAAILLADWGMPNSIPALEETAKDEHFGLSFRAKEAITAIQSRR
jgi:hypothetical protein